MDTFQKIELQKRYPSAWWDLNPDTFTLTADDFLQAYQSEDESYFSFISSHSKEITEMKTNAKSALDDYWGTIGALGQWIYRHIDELTENGCIYHTCAEEETPYLHAIASSIYTAFQEGDSSFIIHFEDEDGGDLEDWLREHESAWLEVSCLGIFSPILIALELKKYPLAKSLVKKFYHSDSILHESIYLMGFESGEKTTHWLLENTPVRSNEIFMAAFELARTLWETKKELQTLKKQQTRTLGAQD